MRSAVKPPAPQSRKLWGILFSTPDERPSLLSAAWCLYPGPESQWDGQPIQLMLFTTRKAAEEMCRKERARHAYYPKGHVCRSWRFRTVRVTETVRVAK